MASKVTRRPKNVVRKKLEQKLTYFEDQFDRDVITLSNIEAQCLVNEIADIYQNYQNLSSEYGEYLRHWQEIDLYIGLQQECNDVEKRYSEFMTMAQIKIEELTALCVYSRHDSRTEVKKDLFARTFQDTQTANESAIQSIMANYGENNPFKNDVERELRISVLEKELTVLQIQKENIKSRYQGPEIFHARANTIPDEELLSQAAGGRSQGDITREHNRLRTQVIEENIEHDRRHAQSIANNLRLEQDIADKLRVEQEKERYQAQTSERNLDLLIDFNEQGLQSSVGNYGECEQRKNDILQDTAMNRSFQTTPVVQIPVERNQDETVNNMTSYLEYKRSAGLNPTSTPFEPGREQHDVQHTDTRYSDHASETDVSSCTSYTQYRAFVRSSQAVEQTDRSIHTGTELNANRTTIELQETTIPLELPIRENVGLNNVVVRDIATSPFAESRNPPVVSHHNAVQTSFRSYQEFREDANSTATADLSSFQQPTLIDRSVNVGNSLLGLDPNQMSRPSNGIPGYNQYHNQGVQTMFPHYQQTPMTMSTTGMTTPQVVPTSTVPTMSYVPPLTTAAAAHTPYPSSTQPLMPPSIVQPPPTVQYINTCRHTNPVQRMDQYLNKVTVPEFSGDVNSFPGWLSTFLRAVDADNTPIDVKLLRLRQVLKGEAGALIANKEHSPETYFTVMARLEKKYGGKQKYLTLKLGELEHMRPIKEDNPQDMERYADMIENLIVSFKNNKMSDQLHPGFLHFKLQEKLGAGTLTRYNRWLDESRKEGNVYNLLDFVERETQHMTRATEVKKAMKSYSMPPPSTQSRVPAHNRRSYTTTDQSESESTTKPKYKLKCRLCTGDHSLWACKKFMELNVEERWSKARTYRVCFRCLNFNHRYEDCVSKKNCGKDGCKLGHHLLLHNPNRRSYNNPNRARTAVGEGQIEEVITLIGASQNVQTSLRTVPIWIANGNKQLEIMALLDDGSTHTYISENVAAELQLKGEDSHMSISTLAGQVRQVQGQNVQFTIMNKDKSRVETLSAQTLRNVVGDLEPVQWNIEKENYEHLKYIPFSEVPKKAKVDLLIGVDYLLLHEPLCEVYGRTDEPVTRKTPIGWTCAGKWTSDGLRIKRNNYLGIRENEETKLVKLMEYMWDIEQYSTEIKTVMSHEDQRAQEIVRNSMKMIDGHYEVALPWKYENAKYDLPNNEIMALNRLRSTEKRLRADATVALLYRNTIKKYEEKEYISIVTADRKEFRLKYFLPHFAITKLDRITTKVRVVFDAAAKVNGVSLNDLLLTGPKLQRNIQDVMLRFRHYAIAIASDVREMYMQILIERSDREAVRFLWRDLQENIEPRVYEINRAAFGLRSSPNAAHEVSHDNAEKHKIEFPRAAESTLESTYMDDTLDSVVSVSQANQLYQELVQLWKKAGMTVCKWASNSRSFLLQIPQDQRFGAIELKAEEAINMKTLGVMWQADKDVFTFKIKKNDAAVTTKRQLLRKVATIYDPLGLASPVIVTGRVLLQEAWINGQDWDEQLSVELITEIKTWIVNVEQLELIQVPRVLQEMEHPYKQELHTFVDASHKAYGAVCYLVNYSSDTIVASVNFVASKVKVAPIKMVSVPRLELLAAVLGTRLAQKIALTLSLKKQCLRFWSDSQNVLYWIIRPTRKFKQFVANRVSVIQERTDTGSWRYVSTKTNPADALSRGTTTEKLNAGTLWWKGPEFLLQGPRSWPDNTKFDIPHIDKETKKSFTSTGSRTDSKPDIVLISQINDDRLKLENHSNLHKAIRLLAWVLRFANRCKKINEERITSYLTAVEIEEAKHAFIRENQLAAYPTEVQKLKKKKSVTTSTDIGLLNPWMDEDGVIRADGRTKLSLFTSWNSKYPVILSGKGRFTTLLILDTHQRVAHGGVNRVLSEIMMEYWMPAARERIRAVINHCVDCKKKKGSALNQQMAPLPEVRTANTMQVFEATSVDMAGPFFTMQGRGKVRQKRYIALFTCMSVRAVHLEVTESMDVNAFMNALVRMSARRGCPKKMFSDQGSNFVAARKELKELAEQLCEEDLGAALEAKGITWKMNPPYAPHHGGVHEALIKSAKTAMKMVVGTADLNDFELITLVSTVEGLLNGRPLCYQSSDFRDEAPLTPNSFIIGRAGAQLRPEEVDPSGANLRTRWRRLQEITTHFWKRWLKECIPLLNTRPKWRVAKENLGIGDVVLLIESDTPRGTWPLGRVVKVHRNPDNHVRTVDVQVGARTYRRPITRLVPILHDIATQD